MTVSKTDKKVTVERDVPATMRDGMVLRADVYRPDAPGKFPVLLQRTPYSKSREPHEEQGHRFAERGYVVVQQDVRGRHTSDGEFLPGFYSAEHRDSEDGYGTVEWAAALPWSTGVHGKGRDLWRLVQRLDSVEASPHATAPPSGHDPHRHRCTY